MPEISVIIPVYNVEKYLERCLNSLVAQTFLNFEVIIVDDGSTDESGKICDSFAKIDPRFQVFHTSNNGVSNARNYAIKNSSGTYLAFLDSDDYIEPDMLARLYQCSALHPEIGCVICSAIAESEDGTPLKIMNEKLPVQKALLFDNYSEVMLVQPAMWNKLFVREIVERFSIRFSPSLSIAEDLDFFLAYLPHCRYFVYEGDAPLYHYIQRNSSAMRSQDPEKNRSVSLAFSHIQDYYKSNNLWEKYYHEIEYLAIFHLYIAASVRIILVDSKHQLLQEICAFMRNSFPDYNRNPYLNLLGRNKRLVFFLLRHKMYKLIRLIFKLKNL